VTSNFPTADQVAALIAAACRETGASPMDVIGGEFDDKQNVSYEYPISRARVYAAAAINEMFGCGRAASSRMCGASKSSYAAHLAVVYSGSAKWFALDALRRVASVIDAERAARITMEREYPRRRVVLTARESVSVVAQNPVSVAACAFKVGDRVVHQTYGAGRVVEIGTFNDHRKDHPLMIKFDGSGREQVMYARVVQSAMTQVVAVVHASRRPESDDFAGPLTLRKTAVPAHLCEDQTADLMGDPPPGRSALSQHVAELYAAIERETRAEMRGDR
jgi:CarD-like protein